MAELFPQGREEAPYLGRRYRGDCWVLLREAIGPYVFLNGVSVGEPTEEDYEESEIEVIGAPEMSEACKLQAWEQADTLVWDSCSGVYSSDESMEFQTTWAIRKLVPRPGSIGFRV